MRRHGARHELQPQDHPHRHARVPCVAPRGDRAVEEGVGQHAARAPVHQDVDGVEGLLVGVEGGGGGAVGEEGVAGLEQGGGGFAAVLEGWGWDGHGGAEFVGDGLVEAFNVHAVQAFDLAEWEKQFALQGERDVFLVALVEVVHVRVAQHKGGRQAVVEHRVAERRVVPCLGEEGQVVEQQDDGVFGGGLVEGRRDLDEGVVVVEQVGAQVGADNGHEAFGRDVVY